MMALFRCGGTALRTLGLLGILLMLSACSALKITYNNAPGLVSWWLDGYLDFSVEQQEILQPRLQAVHAWHRQHELPAYVALLKELQTQALVDIEAERACELVTAMLAHVDLLNARFEPVVAVLAPTLDDTQLNHLQEKFEESNEEWREEWMDGSEQERKDYRLQQAVKRAESFYGDLEAGQVDIIRRHVAGSSFRPEISYAERLRRQQDALRTLTLLKQDLPQARGEAETHQYFRRLASSPDPAFRDYFATILHESCATIAELHNSTSQEQRAQAAEKLRDYEADLQQLQVPAMANKP